MIYYFIQLQYIYAIYYVCVCVFYIYVLYILYTAPVKSIASFIETGKSLF